MKYIIPEMKELKAVMQSGVKELEAAIKSDLKELKADIKPQSRANVLLART